MGSNIEQVMHDSRILAIIIRSQAIDDLEKSGKNILFATPDEFPFQVGIHHRKKNETIPAHFHIPFIELTNFPVQEFFHVLSGRVKIDLYDDSHNDAKVSEVIVAAGDSIILNTGHGFTFLDDAKMVELKQGPYRGKEQEKRFVQ